MAPALERRQVVLQRRARGVLAAAVVVAVLGDGRVLLHVGRGAVDGRHDGARGRVRALAGVDGEGSEAHDAAPGRVGRGIVAAARGRGASGTARAGARRWPAEVAPVVRRAVLVVDDDPAVGALVAAVLRREDIAVELALDGEQALRRLDAGGPELVLTDMTMPGLSGLDLVRASESRGHRVPFLVMSAYLDPETERLLCLEAGVSGVLRKPFDIARLVRDVRAVLERPRAAPPCWELVRWQPPASLFVAPARRPAP
ncbi:MAG: response regulator, partial [Planctomycetes bacterium]|nr:response regulator [Planctomycetota bacterium]